MTTRERIHYGLICFAIPMIPGMLLGGGMGLSAIFSLDPELRQPFFAKHHDELWELLISPLTMGPLLVLATLLGIVLTRSRSTEQH